jgi:hypothetical protein
MKNNVFRECLEGNHNMCPREITASGECPNDGSQCSCSCHQKIRQTPLVTVSITPHDSG